MGDPATREIVPDEPSRNTLGVVLFMALFMFFWITTNPYVDLTGAAVLDPNAENSNRLNQIVTIILFVGMVVFAASHPMRRIIMRPYAFNAAVLGWFLLAALASRHPDLGIKALILNIVVLMMAGVFLLLPASERQFGKMLGIGTMIMLGFAYYGVIFLPQYSIHQLAELREPMNAGFWRGHFPHKNSAAGAMVIAAFFGLFVASVWSRWVGIAIVVLSCFFLMHTGGKSASGMFPMVLVLGWIFEKYRRLRAPIAVGSVAAFNLLAVGSAVIKPFQQFVTDLGIDATFTNRADIWRLAFSAAGERPITGYGLKGFWQTKELVYSGGSVETWAVAAFNGHNSYADTLVQGGFPGLILTLILVLFMPLRDLGRVVDNDTHSNVTRLFIRIWLYTLLNAGLETIFFEGGSVLWFMFVVSLYAFKLRTSHLVVSTDPAPNRNFAHA